MSHRTASATRFPQPRLLAAALATCLLTAVPAAFAQATAASVRGQVTNATGPAGSAEITATNIATGLVRRVQSNANGAYSLAGLPPGTWRIDVTADGATSSRTIILQVGQVATLDLAVDGGAPIDTATMDTVTVTAQAIAETKTSEIATYISQKQIDAIPQINRNFLAFADTVPGVIFSQNSDGTTKLRSGGQNSNGINVFIDGVGQKNYVLKGGISGQDGSRGNPFPQSAIGEYKVITQNYKAEFDQISSAAIVALTKSGSNELHGDAFFDYTHEGWRAIRPAERAGGKKIETMDKQYGASLGGPIIKDTLFFFASYEYKEIITPGEVAIGDNSVPISLLPPAAQAELGPTSTPFEEDLYFAKLTWTPDENNLFELSGKHRVEDDIQGNTGANAYSFASTKHQEETRTDLRWQFISGNWLNDAHITFEDSTYEPKPLTLDGYGSHYVFFRPSDNQQRSLLNVGAGENYQNKGQKGWAIQDDLTWSGLEWAGNHVFKGGFKYKEIEIRAFERQPYSPQYFFDVYGSLSIPFQVQFGEPVPGRDPNVVTTSKQFGIYFQDDWEVNSKLTLNLGLRWDYEKVPSYLDYRPSAELASALRSWANLQNADYDIENFIGNGSNRKAFKDAWQPRLGFSYDLFEDQRHVIFGGAGRAYDRNLFDYLALERSKGSYPRYVFNFDTVSRPCEVGVGNCLAWDPAYFNRASLAALVATNPNIGGEVNLLSNDLKTPYSDQFSLGMRNTVTMGGIDWNTSATLSYVESKDGIYFALGNRWPNGSFRENPAWTWGGQPWGQPIPGFGTLIIADNGIETRTKSALFSLEKPYTEDSGWGVTFAYTYTHARENRLNAALNDEHYVFDYPNPDGQGFLRSLGIPRHRLVVTGILDGPGGVMYSAKATFASPVPKEAVNCYDATSFNGCFFDPYTPDGTFGTKQIDLAATKYWDLGEGIAIRLRADVLNVLNTYNWDNYETWRGGPGSPNANFGNRNGNGITTPTRTFKLSLGISF
ncbi:MAG TPA: TonB-dependent receptor [Dokdonella sp.]|uniref:TonB-dependent receptor n=1 Tax=Dokdonella sp. TaxID=2291710 RepID=UPI0025B980E8|nr:TonB-dependent receptor [Dokdonella sp.]MBX3691799.1 TonB-dependent receptor [Dokdonella sp.]MCW5568016.1 TonB-dependent receptor [Dokdonella sp.]HNR90800.1 TonB-dependent receptor [Dokdonella sp.]